MQHGPHEHLLNRKRMFMFIALVPLLVASAFLPLLSLSGSTGPHARPAPVLAGSVRHSTLSHGPAYARPLGITITSFTILPNTILVGQTTYLNLTVSGASPPYIYNYTSGMPQDCPQKAQLFATSSNYSVSCTTNIAGFYTVQAYAANLSKPFSGAIAYANFTVNSAPTGPTITSFIASPNQIRLGQTTYLNVTANGGTPPYAYAYGALPPGCTSSNTFSLQCTPTKTGNYSVGVTVTDSKGLYASSQTALSVSNPPGPLISSFVSQPSTFTVGKTAQLKVTANGGTLPYSYVYSSLPSGCSTSNSPTLNCTPGSAGSYNVNVTVTDANGYTARSGVGIRVNALPSISSFVASPSTVTVGGTTTLKVSTAGGTAPFAYAYSQLPTGCTSLNTSSLACTPTVQGNFTPTVSVRDADGFSAGPSATQLTVNGPPAVSSVIASPSIFPLESTTYINVTVTGGSPPYQYAYNGLPSGCTSSSSPHLVCTPTVSGTFKISVAVADASGKFAAGATTMTVTPVPNIPSFTANPSTVAAHALTVLSVVARGGAPPYLYVYTNLPPGCGSSNTNNLSCSPIATGKFNVTVTVTDNKGNSNSSHVPLTVVAAQFAPIITSFQAAPNPAQVRTPVTISATVTGGKTPYSYNYSGLPPGCASGNNATLTCTPLSNGNFTIRLVVTDSNGKAANATTSLSVKGSVVTLTVSLVASSTSVKLGSTITLTANVSGGVYPFSFVWSANGNVSGAPNAPTWTWTPAKSGTYTAQVWVTDERSIVAKSNGVPITVVSSSSGTTHSTPLYNELWPLLFPIIAVVAVVLLIYLRKRRSSSSEQGATENQPQGPLSSASQTAVNPEAPLLMGDELSPARVEETNEQQVSAMDTPHAELSGPPLQLVQCTTCGMDHGPDMTCPQCGTKGFPGEDPGSEGAKEVLGEETMPAETRMTEEGQPTPGAQPASQSPEDIEKDLRRAEEERLKKVSQSRLKDDTSDSPQEQ